MSKEKICGVYCIENLVNHKKYIGSSIDIYNRWNQHKRTLKNGKHHSKHLQNSFDYYGDDCFFFYILETCSSEMLLKTEQKWIDKYNVCDINNGYNMSSVAGGGCSYGDTYDGLKNGKYSITYEQFNNIVYLLQTTDVSIKEISEIVDCNASTIYSIYQKKNYNSLTKDIDFVVRRVDCQYNGHTKITEHQAKEIISMLINGKTVLDICELTGVSRNTISDIKNKHSWKELTKEIEFPKPKSKHPNKRVSILQFDLDMNLIEKFDSVTSAKEKLNIKHTSNLSACLKGKRKTAYGFIWKYAA